jgi:hypothetical protein
MGSQGQAGENGKPQGPAEIVKDALEQYPDLPELEDSEIIVLALQHYAVRHTSRAAHAIGTPNHGEHVRRAERARALAEQTAAVAQRARLAEAKVAEALAVLPNLPQPEEDTEPVPGYCPHGDEDKTGDHYSPECVLCREDVEREAFYGLANHLRSILDGES